MVPGRPRSTGPARCPGAGRLRGGDRRRHRQLPAQRAAGLHRPAGRRATCGPTPATRSGTRAWPARRCTTSATGIPTAVEPTCPGVGVRLPRGAGRADRRPAAVPGHGPRPALVRGARQPRQHAAGHGAARGLAARLPGGPVKFVTPPDGLDAAELLRRFDDREADALLELAAGPQLQVTPDPGRTPVHQGRRTSASTSGPRARPAGHGYTRAQRRPRAPPTTASITARCVRCIVLDTVNPHGGWQGSLDATQLGWLEAELTAHGRPGRCCCSATTRWRRWSTTGGRQAPTAGSWPTSCATSCSPIPCVVAWVNGHTHVHTVTRDHREDGAGRASGRSRPPRTSTGRSRPGSSSCWPTDRGLAIACTVIDSAAPRQLQARRTRPSWRRCPASWPPTTGSPRPITPTAPARGAVDRERRRPSTGSVRDADHRRAGGRRRRRTPPTATSDPG